MASGNQVVLEFAGETKKVEDAFRRVGSASQDMGKAVDRSGDAFDRATDRADAVDTRAMGFRDTLTGIEDGTKGIKQAAAGDWGFETLLLIGFGIGDLASGMVNFLIPALKSTRLAQIGLNIAQLASPTTWIILGIIALVAIFVVLWIKFEGFRNFWKATWDVIKRSASAAWDWIKSAASNTWDWIKQVPGWIGSAFSKVASLITAPFRSAFAFIAWAWNNTIGRLSWTVPGWIPGIGGNTISVPRIPTFHSGGVVPGAPGSETLAVLQAGETVIPAGSAHKTAVLEIRSGGTQFDDLLVEVLGRAVRLRGGNVQLVLGDG